MRNPLKTDRSTGLGMLLARLPMGIFFICAGYAKLDHWKSDTFASNYSDKLPTWGPHEWGMHYLQGIPYAEMAVGALLIIGLLTRLCGLVGALMVATFTYAITGWRTPPGQPFNLQANFIFIGLLLAIFLVGPGRLSLDGLLFGRKSPPPPPAAD
jgi:putative oxidoreductase